MMSICIAAKPRHAAISTTHLKRGYEIDSFIIVDHLRHVAYLILPVSAHDCTDRCVVPEGDITTGFRLRVSKNPSLTYLRIFPQASSYGLNLYFSIGTGSVETTIFPDFSLMIVHLSQFLSSRFG